MSGDQTTARFQRKVVKKSNKTQERAKLKRSDGGAKADGARGSPLPRSAARTVKGHVHMSQTREPTALLPPGHGLTRMSWTHQLWGTLPSDLGVDGHCLGRRLVFSRGLLESPFLLGA